MEIDWQQIEDKIKLISDTDSPDLIAETRLWLATQNYYIGQKMADLEFSYKVELNNIRKSKNETAAGAKIEAEAGETYRGFLKFRQAYNDIKATVSSARTRLDILKDQRFG